MFLPNISPGQPSVSSKKTEMCVCLYICGIGALQSEVPSKGPIKTPS